MLRIARLWRYGRNHVETHTGAAPGRGGEPAVSRNAGVVATRVTHGGTLHMEVWKLWTQDRALLCYGNNQYMDQGER